MEPPAPTVVSLKKLLAEHTTAAAPELVRPENGALRCLACGHRCRIRPGREGVCRVRFNRDGELRVPHGYVAGLAADPIEKKPFFHAFPGRNALSFGMLGCNLHCSFCQNWVSSQTLRDPEAIARPEMISAEDLVQLAVEWAVEIFRLGQQRGLVGALVSNGFGTPEALEFLRPYCDLFKIDLKTMQDPCYRMLGGVLEDVLDTIRRASQMGFWVEIVTLVVPELNDSDEELKQIAEFIAGVSEDIPWHVTAFHPEYKHGGKRTPAETLLTAREIGLRAGLKYVYAGNLPYQLGQSESTFCPQCGELLIERRGFQVASMRVKGGRCPKCNTRIAGVWADTAEQATNPQA
jgi:pyruvate formate lyase activating enzyme